MTAGAATPVKRRLRRQFVEAFAGDRLVAEAFNRGDHWEIQELRGRRRVSTRHADELEMFSHLLSLRARIDAIHCSYE